MVHYSGLSGDKCPLKSCEEPWSEHDGIKKIVHSERAEAERGCTCPVFGPHDPPCPIHGG